MSAFVGTVADAGAEELARQAVDAAFVVRRELGAGVYESLYQKAFAIELESRGIPFEREVPMKATYRGHDLGVAFRADFTIGNKVLFEAKAVKELCAIHEAQTLTYLRVSGLPIGLLVKFQRHSVQVQRPSFRPLIRDSCLRVFVSSCLRGRPALISSVKAGTRYFTRANPPRSISVTVALAAGGACTGQSHVA